MTGLIGDDAKQPSADTKPLGRLVAMFYRPFTGFIVLITSLVFTLSAYLISTEHLAQRFEAEFKLHSQEILYAIEDRMHLYEQALWGAVGLINASRQVTRQEWRAYVDTLTIDQHLPDIQALGYVAPLTPAQRTHYIEAIQAQGLTDFHVHPSGHREYYTPIVYIEPFHAQNQKALGYDMWVDLTRQTAMQRARDNGIAVTSGSVTLAQGLKQGQQRGFLTYVPIYKIRHTPDSIAQRRVQLKGWAYAAFHAEDLMGKLVKENAPPLDFDIFDGKNTHVNNLIYQYQSGVDRKAEHILRHVTHIELQTHFWTIAVYGSPKALLSRQERHQPRYVLIAGLILNTLIFYVFLALISITKIIQTKSNALQKAYEENKNVLVEQAKYVENKETEAKAFFDLVPHALVIVSASGKIVRANQQAHNIFAYEDKALINTSIETLVPTELREQHVGLRTQFQEAPSQRIMSSKQSLYAITRTGDQLDVVINLVPIQLNGEKHTVASIQDLTELRANEQKLAQARKTAEQANKAKSEFLANMSHEIRTPLNAVLGSAQLLEKTKPHAAQKKYIHTIRSSGEALLGIINDILDFSKIEAGKMELSSIDFKLDDLIARVASLMAVTKGEKPIDLFINIDADVPNRFIGDALRIQQILINLISNAIKFTEAGKVTLSIKTIDDTNANHCALHFTVSDTGIGMSKTQLDNLFQAFSQADTSITRRFGGTGLGLTISNRILALMNSKLEVGTAPGEGSQFFFEIQLPTKADNPSQQDKPNLLMLAGFAEDDRKSAELIAQRMQVPILNFESIDALLKNRALLNEFGQYDTLLIDDDAEGYNRKRIVTLQEQDQFPAIMLILCQHSATNAFDINIKKRINAMTKPLNAAALKTCFKELLTAKKTGAENATPEGFSLHCKTLLLVEDNLINQSIAEEILLDMGIRVDIANNGQEAIDKVKANDYPIILMDIQMPVMDGITATKHLREQLHYEKPIIAMTAGVLESERREYFQAGLDGIVPKPIEQRELYLALKNNLNKTQNTTDINEQKMTEDHVHFNAERLERLINGKPARAKKFSEALQGILDDGEHPINDSWDKIIQNNRQGAKETLHTFKGVTANFGADYLRECIQTVEVAINNDETLENLEKQFADIRVAANTYFEAVTRWLEELNG